MLNSESEHSGFLTPWVSGSALRKLGLFHSWKGSAAGGLLSGQILDQLPRSLQGALEKL